MRTPNPAPREKKIWLAAAIHTCTQHGDNGKQDLEPPFNADRESALKDDASSKFSKNFGRLVSGVKCRVDVFMTLNGIGCGVKGMMFSAQVPDIMKIGAQVPDIFINTDNAKLFNVHFFLQWSKHRVGDCSYITYSEKTFGDINGFLHELQGHKKTMDKHS